ncbi:hypothetical protein Q1695_015119 [Nippostrongylus brasiliensis]|nr:hypothetical protein Q1695_015119 [Nippostrongylus brasiliensis]
MKKYDSDRFGYRRHAGRVNEPPNLSTLPSLCFKIMALIIVLLTAVTTSTVILHLQGILSFVPPLTLEWYEVSS